MEKFHFTKREKLFLLLALLVLVFLFISSSMTYHEQELHDGTVSKYFGWLEILWLAGILLMADAFIMHN
jgi:hypothetical protein